MAVNITLKGGGELYEDILKKIDKPTVAGTAGQVLTSDGNGGQTWTTIQNESVAWTTLYSGSATIVDWGDAVNYVQMQNFFETGEHIYNGDVWRITWNNTRYVCTATEILNDLEQYGTGYVLGNATISGGTSGNSEPFCAYEYYNGTLMFDTHQTTGSIGLIIEKQISVVPIQDVQVNGTSVVQNGVANISSNIFNAMLASVETDATADQAYAIGEMFTYNNKLYKATAAITLGGTITPNTNCTETTLANEILARSSIMPAAGVSF